MQNNLLDYKQDEQSIKKVIDKEINGKSKRLFDPNTYYSQFQNLTSESLQQCEKSQGQKGAKEMIEFKAQVTSQDKVIEAIRAANFVEIQNVNFKFKRLLKEILQQIADQLGNLFKDEYLKLWLEWKSAKAALMDKEVKLKNSEMSQQLQEQELIQIRTEFTAQNTFLSMNKQLEATVQNLETENNKLKDSLKNLNQYCNELKQNNEELNKRMKKLEQQFEEAKEKYENEINQLKLKEQNLIRANKDLIDLNNQLSQQLDKYRDLYEMQNQKNNDLADQVRYWKSTHYNKSIEISKCVFIVIMLFLILQISLVQQRLTDLQQSETRIGSQKGYLFKYRREVQDLKRFKLYSEEAQKELSNARQTVHLLNQQTEQLKFSYENAIQQNLQIQTEKTENLNQILLRNAQSTKKVNNETNVFYESPQKSKFDFHSVKKITQPSVDELSQFVVSYSKVPIQSRRTKVRSVSAQKNSQSETDTSKNNIGIQEFDLFTPYTESNLNQFNFNSVPKHPLSKNKRIKRQNTES